MISSVINLSMLGREKKKKTISSEITNFMIWLNFSIGLEDILLCSQIIVIASIISLSWTINFSSLSGPGLNVVLVVFFCKMKIELNTETTQNNQNQREGEEEDESESDAYTEPEPPSDSMYSSK